MSNPKCKNCGSLETVASERPDTNIKLCHCKICGFTWELPSNDSNPFEEVLDES